VKQTANSTPTYYLWSSVFGQPALELNSSGNVVRAYVFSSSGQRVALQASNGSFYWVHGDHLGSSHMLTDTSGSVAYRAEYDPHGNLRLETGTTTLTTRKFTGYERDAANLDFAQARTYGYRRGRFLQPDPLGLGAGDLTNPQSLNLYSYVQNDPINLVDPTGLNCRAYTYEWSGWTDGVNGEDPTYHVNQTQVVWVCDGNFGGGGGGGPIDSGGGGGGQQGSGDKDLSPFLLLPLVGAFKSDDQCADALKDALGRLGQFLVLLG
jgi:RHS repeat-associated protein